MTHPDAPSATDAEPRAALGRSTVLGYPRIGRRREVKVALERHWAGELDDSGLRDAVDAERRRGWETLTRAGLTSVPVGTSSMYDHVLDTSLTVLGLPPRFRDVAPADSLEAYFACCRGTTDQPPLEMTKWFDTNYHFLVPEVDASTPFELHAEALVAEVADALAAGVPQPRPVLVGPFTLLSLAKSPAGGRRVAPTERLDELVEVYAELLRRLHEAGAPWVQLDEPFLVTDLDDDDLAAVRRAYGTLGSATERPALLVATYFGSPGSALPVLADSPVEAVAVDLAAGTTVEDLATAPNLRHKTLVAGVVDGRNVWRADLAGALSTLAVLSGLAGDVVVSTSCSLLHVPYDLRDEDGLPDDVRSWLAFADEKVDEVALLGRGLADGRAAVSAEVDDAAAVLTGRAGAPSVVRPEVRDRVTAAEDVSLERVPYAERVAAQSDRLRLPHLPTTTIGSFPQVSELRRARAAVRRGTMDDAEYDALVAGQVERAVRLQEEVGLDVVVHGEPERNDMVQYFGERLDGFVVTSHGWVQSYGSRCVKPPVLYGDVSRPEPMTVRWSTYAQSLTDRPVKGMLTGPVTILAWSFVRDDLPLGEVARQVALAIRDEVADLEDAGLSVVQVDEPALRELLPLKESDRPAYLRWAVDAFRLATSGAAASTQVHTHLCYSEFTDVVGAIDELDADVTSIEAARSGMELLDQLSDGELPRGLGPGVYDIHSPRVPSEDEVMELLRRALAVVPAGRLWVNPDCGLKTRRYSEIEPALRHLVTAARSLREGGGEA